MTNANQAPFAAVRETQDIYRRMLDCMARPGKMNSLSAVVQKRTADLPCSQAIYSIARTLIDHEVSFYFFKNGTDTAARYLEWTTGSTETMASQADYLFFETQPDKEQIRALMSQVRVGTLLEPEKSATLIVRVRGLAASAELPLKLELRGPGIKEKRTLYIGGFDLEWIESRSARNREYPMGCDFILVADDGAIAAIPRTTRIESEGM